MDEFKVIKIIDDYKVVINAGYQNNVTKKDVFEIYVVGEQVYDPDTEEPIGTLDIIKATITPITIYDKMSICINTQSDLNSLAQTGLLLQGIYSGKSKRLNVDNTQITGGLSSPDEIKIGDKVRKIPSNT